MRRTQFFEHFEYSDNPLITNALYLNPPFSILNTSSKSFTFKFLYRCSSKAENYTFLNILFVPHSLLF